MSNQELALSRVNDMRQSNERHGFMTARSVPSRARYGDFKECGRAPMRELTSRLFIPLRNWWAARRAPTK